MRAQVTVPVDQSKHVAVSNLLIGSAREGLSGIRRCRSCFAFLIIPSFFHTMFEKHSKQKKGFGRKLLIRPRHLSLPHVGAVAQWLVRATDDRVVAGSNPSTCRRFKTWGVGQVRLPHVARVFRMRHNKLLFSSI